MTSFIKSINKDLIKINEEIAKKSKSFNQFIKDSKDSDKPSKLSGKIGEFTGKSFLMIPSKVNDTGERNTTDIRQNSTGVQVINEHGRRVNTIQPNQNYQIEALIENKGDIFMPAVNVEFFCSPRYRPYKMEFEITKYHIGFLGLRVTGILKKGKLSIGDHLQILGDDNTYPTRLNGISITGGSHHTVIQSGNEITLFLSLKRNLRTNFKNDIQPGDMVVESNEEPLEDKMFRFRVEETFSPSTGSGTIVTGTIEQGLYDTTAHEKLNLFTGIRNGQAFRGFFNKKPSEIRPANNKHLKPGDQASFLFPEAQRSQFRRGDMIVKSKRETFSKDPHEHKDPDVVNELEYIGRLTTHLNNFHSKKVKIDWKAPDKKDRRDYVFTARAYSTMPYDMPTNFNLLNPNLDRHIGVRKMDWNS